MPSERVLLDAVRAPLHPAARETLLAAVDAGWADPRRLHAEGRRARRLLDQAREVLADGVGVRPDELSFHLIGAEALTVAVAGLRHARRRVGDVLLASAVELEVLLLADPVRTVPVDGLGRVDATAFVAALSEPGVVAAALQHANGEVGTTQPLEVVHEASRRAGVPLLVDATASLGRVATPTAFDVLAADAVAFSGPPLGLLAVRTGTRFAPPGPVREGEQGRALSAPWVPMALAAAEAWRQVAADRAMEESAARALVDRVRAAVASVDGVGVVGDPDDRLPHVLSLVVDGLDGELLAAELDERGLAVASGSACSASPLHPSHVLTALGIPQEGRPRPGNIRLTLPVRAVAPGLKAGVARLCRELGTAVAAVRARVGPVVR
jgi:cysteine desulfurase